MNMNLPAIGIEYLVVAMSGVILYLVYYVFSKDTQYQRNIHSVASVVEELSKEMFYLKNKLKEAGQNISKNTSHMSDDEIYQEIERSVYDMVKPLSIGLKRMEEQIGSLDTKIDNRISNLENGVKQISIPLSVHGNDDEKIIALYKQGVTLDTVSKELHISKAEVEFVLKINQIK